MPLTPVHWQGCYRDGWQDLIVPDAFAHPAKYARGLIHRVYRHLIEQGDVRAGETVLDPFGGVALGALDAMTYGLRWVGVELEPRFVDLAQQNLTLWRQRYGFTGGTVVQGDSRQLRSVLAGQGIQACVGSPPFVGSLSNGETVSEMKARWGESQLGGDWGHSYGTFPGQLGTMPPGRLACVSSPPYAEGLSKEHTYTDHAKRDKPSHRRIMTEKGIVDPFYGASPGQLGAEPTTFWAASAQIMTELAALLPPRAVCAWVLKAYVKDKQIVPFPDQWRQLCEAHGFTLCEEIHASLVEKHGTQEGLFSGPQVIQTKRASFFRRLAEKKGSPIIDHETILIMRKASYEETVPGLWEGIDGAQ